MKRLKIISVCTLKDISIWEISSKYIIKYIKADEYLLIVPQSQIETFAAVTPEKYLIKSEDEYLINFKDKLYNKIQNKERYGWYLQQFIKLEVLYRLKPFENAVIWDADTVPLRSVNFFDQFNKPIYYISDEYHLPYFRTIRLLLNYDKIISESFVSQSFPITYELGFDFFQTVEDKHLCKWYDALINCIDGNEYSSFSEYETLGTFISNKFPDSFKFNVKKWSRYGYRILKRLNTEMTEYGMELIAKRFDFDFVSFEKWDLEEVQSNERNNLIGKIFSSKSVKKLFSILNFNEKKEWSSILDEIFKKNKNLQVIQIGANDGIQNDPIRKYLEKAGNYSAILVEAIPHYVDLLNKLYSNRSDIQIIHRAAGSTFANSTIFHIPPHIAIQMDGIGPKNNWALGQGSFSRENVVYWIHKNIFRGLEYKSKLKFWISQIEEVPVEVVPIASIISNYSEAILLVIDVQGFELEVLKGVDWNFPPKYILIEEDISNHDAREFIIEKNYNMISSESDNIIFKYKN